MIIWYYPFQNGNSYKKPNKKIPSFPGIPVIPPLPNNPPYSPYAAQCGECGILIPNGAWGYSCPSERCPVQHKVWC